MPGILPMKVIKVGASSQSRIAQACDRCRSKKIRCDGIRPTCTQCATVGFECKTSDKLSRRAFPRGYTESLEERVRALEAEVRGLKELLDEKDGRPLTMSSPATHSPATRSATGNAATLPTDDTFRVQPSPLLLRDDNANAYYAGPSSGRAFLASFKRRLHDKGKPSSDFNPDAFLHAQGCSPCCPLVETHKTHNTALPRIPPRMFSDRCVNIFFQEWAPLFPVLHKPTFLRTYEDWLAEPDKVTSPQTLAQLYLVFGVAALSSESPDLEHIAACEQQWQPSLDAILMDDTIETLQCLLLALTYCQIRADTKRLQHYKCLAVGLSHRLALHQLQNRFSLGTLTVETRKKVFWALYTLDSFSAASLGLPKLIREEDVHTEYPNDVDDEYVTEEGFLPMLPGESTRLSAALALFRASRILAKVLHKNYPAATGHELSLQQMSALDAELERWSNTLPQHLKLAFKQDRPSTNITGSRSPLLAVAYYFIRTLIYRPAIGSSLGHRAAPAVIAVAESSKHMIQIIQLLQERSMSFSFCLHKMDLLFLCGLSLLYQSLDLEPDSMMLKDIEKLVNALLKIVGRCKAHSTHDWKRIASIAIRVDEPPTALPTPPGQRAETTGMAAPPQKAPTAKPKKKKKKPSLSASPHDAAAAAAAAAAAVSPGNPTQPSYSPVQIPHKAVAGGMSASEWEALLGQIDSGQANLYDAIYGGPQVTLDTPVAAVASSSSWSPDVLDLSGCSLGDCVGGSGLRGESLGSVSGGDDLASLDLRDFSAVGGGATI